MRMDLVNGGALWHEVQDGDITIDGHCFPAGTDVGVGVYSIHHHGTYYPDLFAFRPERWIVGLEFSESDVKLAYAACTPFPIRPRGCVGKWLAIVQLVMAMARVLVQYDFKTLDFDPNLAKMGEDVEGARYPRNLIGEFQTKGTFSSILRVPMLSFKKIMPL
jgi:hypothetical protein